MRSVQIRAYAKINLGLRVLKKRPDGYHEIDTIIQSIDLADEFVLKARSDGTIVLTMEPDWGIPPEENLAMRAARLMVKEAQAHSGVSIHLRKRIPIRAGLGGGSSDAAAVLAGLKELFELKLSKDEFKALGVQLGSDVLFFLGGGCCRARGRGEIVQKLPDDPTLETIVLLIAPFSLSTREVYETFDGFDPAVSAPLSASYLNDLEATALRLRPDLRVYREFLVDQSVPFGLSGSGPTYYALIHASKDSLIHFVRQAQAALSCEVHICHPTKVGHEIISSL